MEYSANNTPSKTNVDKFPRAGKNASVPHQYEQEIPSYVEKKAVQVRDSGPSDSARMSVEIPTSGSLIKFAAKKNSLISLGEEN